MVQKSVQLSTGYQIPVAGLGTWQSPEGVIGKVVKTALDTGYRHLDCAQGYGNEAEIGDALEEYYKTSSLKREDIFITSKVWNTCHSYERCCQSVEDILHRFKTNYIDLVLIHWPHGFQEGGELFPRVGDQIQYSDVDYLETWKALEKKVEEGKIRSIGLSNFNIAQIQRVIDNGKIKPVALEVEAHLYFQQKELRKFCQENNIVFIAYSPLGSPGSTGFWRQAHSEVNVLKDPIVLNLSKKYQKSPAQIILRWELQNNILIIPKSTNEARLQENFDLFDFNISGDDMKQLDQ
uniref:NADP-dependent oxidoreductase domain-containing protein n=1 Tax=Acrobeloides nanus TaxID=290746 RepID=A0A914E4K2_9BILA